MSRKTRLTLLLSFILSFHLLPLSLFALPSIDQEGSSEAEAAAAAKGGFSEPEIVYYESDGLQMKAFLYKPAGKGPFPAYLWNHGSDQNPSDSHALAKFWNEHGFVFFVPVRRGHGGNPGDWIVEQEKILKANAANRRRIFSQIVQLHEKENDDVVAAYRWLRKQAFVDSKRVVVAGGSYGGIQTLLMAERDGREKLGVRCFIAMSPAAMSWGKGMLWGPRLSQAVKNATAPIFLLQAENDFNLGPSEVLGPQVDAKGPPSRHKVFPPHLVPGMDPSDHRQGHGKFFADSAAWQTEVLKYLEDCGFSVHPAQHASAIH